jgi:hypothetical protein
LLFATCIFNTDEIAELERRMPLILKQLRMRKGWLPKQLWKMEVAANVYRAACD